MTGGGYLATTPHGVADRDPLTVRAKENIVFCVLTLLFNTMAIALIAISPRLRKASKFHIIASMSVANILACLVYFPLDTKEALEADLSVSVDPTTRVILRGLYSYCVPSVLPLSLVFIGIDYMVNRVYEVSTQSKIMTTVTGIVVPWTLGFISLFPFTSMHLTWAAAPKNLTQHVQEAQDAPLHKYASEMHQDSDNVSQLSQKLPDTETATVPVSLALSLVLLWGVLPLTLAFVTTMSSVILRCFFTKSRNYMAASSSYGRSSMPWDEEENLLRTISLMDTLVSTLAMVVLSIPFLVEVISNLSCSPYGQCSEVVTSDRSTALARWSVSFLLPAIWILDGDFREAVSFVLGKLCLGSCVVYY